MNINLIFEKNIYLIALFVHLFSFSIHVQSQNIELGNPNIKNITPKISGFRDNNFTISQDTRGFIYVGNSNGIIEHDGFNWKRIPFSGNPILYKDKFGTIFCGGYNSIKFLSPDKNGAITCNSVYEDTTYNFGQISKLIVEKNQILFSTEHEIYVFKDSVLSKVVTDLDYVNIFYIHNQFYIINASGIYNLRKNNIYPLQNIGELRGIRIFDMIETVSGFTILTEEGLFDYQNETLIKRNSELDGIFYKLNITSAVELSDKVLVIGTKTNGLFFLNKNRNIIYNLTKDNGLYDNQINNLFVDADNKLWVAFSNGLCLIEIPSAYSYYNQNNGLKGKVNDIIRFNSNLYVATSQGLYFLNKTRSSILSQKEDFTKISSISENCNMLKVIDDVLIAGTEKGIFVIDGENIKHIYKGVVNCIIIDKTDKHKFYYTDDNYLMAGFYINKKWSFSKPLTKVSSRIYTIAQDGTKIWIGTKHNGVFSISTLNNNNIKVNYNRSNNSLPNDDSWIDVYQTTNDVIFSTSQGLYRYDANTNLFTKDSLLNISSQSRFARVKPIVEDIDNNLWISYDSEKNNEKNIAVAWNIENANKYTFISQPFKRINEIMCESIYPDKNFVVWFGGFEGLVRLDFKKLKQAQAEIKTYIRSIAFNDDSIITYSPEFLNAAHHFSMPYNNNSIKIEYSTPIYLKNENIQHQTFLKGFDKDWTKPMPKHSQAYTNLNPGTYTFQVRAIDYFENISNPSSITFTIISPFYTRWWAIAMYIIIGISGVLLILRWRAYQFAKEKANLEKIISDRTEELLLEKEKTERLLANILPERTVKELKDKGKASSMKFDMVTVLFSDIQGFTRIAEQMNPDTLVDQLDKFFLQFDRVVDKYNIEKIKTIGDAYMCAGGIPQKNRTNPIEVVIAALEMQNQIRIMKEQAGAKGEDYWGLRIGIHTGPVVAGVIGSKKFTYDIWGDSVNIASRMESSGEVGKVNISEYTYLLIKEYFDCEYRGKMPVKYKGEIDMYFVKGFKPQFCNDKLRISPNREFLIDLALLRYDDLHEFMLDKLEKELPKNLYYHDLKHTIDVVVHIEIIATDEGVSKEELLILKTAALFHDAGFMIGYRDHESLGIQLANEILPKWDYSPEQISIIGDLIFATKMPYNPKNKLEEIICDADLDYLGRSDYLPVSRNLYRELIEQEIINKSEADWNKIQLKFLQSHRFYTDSSKRRRNGSKNEQLKKIKDQNFRFDSELKKT